MKYRKKTILTKGLTKYFIDKFSILNGAKLTDLVFIADKKYIKCFTGTNRFES